MSILNFESNIENTYVYRIFSFENFMDLLVNNHLTFVSPKLWDDPYENYILKNVKAYNVFRRCLFGQCWSLNKETDFMWRVYAPNKNGIKVKCKLSVLYNHLTKYKKNKNYNLTFGKVKYVKQSDLRNLWVDFIIDKDKETDNWGRLPISTVFFKRNEFKHENEFRVMYWDYDEQRGQFKEPKKVVKWNIDKNVLISSITIDPRVSKEQFETWKSIIKNLGLTKPVFHSQLYTFKKIIEL